jgi:hypothetical protein
MKPLQLSTTTDVIKKIAMVIALTLFAGIKATLAVANPGDPQSLEEVNRFRRVYSSLTQLQTTLPDAPKAVESSKDSISKTVLLMGYSNLSVDRLKKILKWTGETDPLFKPGVVPESGVTSPPPFIFDRAQNWKAPSADLVSIDIVWTPVSQQEPRHFIETQWYRKDGDMWYLFKQDRREIAGCNKWPRCEGDPA